VRRRNTERSGQQHPRSTAFLLTQVGALAASKFADRLSSTGLAPHHAGILRTIAKNPGISQQTLASLLGMLPSRLVTYLDELEGRGLLERHDNPEDRRLYALRLTEQGTNAIGEIGRVARAHDDEVCAPLSPDEREQLSSLLSRLADHHGLTPGVHPGFAKLRPGSRPAPKKSGAAREKRRGDRP
jgi:DNA-binding MarR family transcriptional regulator